MMTTYIVGVTEHYGEILFNLSGPGTGFGAHAGTLFKNMTFKDRESAEAAAACANEAFDVGYRKAQKQMRDALGIKP
jgi:hypothetical protein